MINSIIIDGETVTIDQIKFKSQCERPIYPAPFNDNPQHAIEWDLIKDITDEELCTLQRKRDLAEEKCREARRYNEKLIKAIEFSLDESMEQLGIEIYRNRDKRQLYAPYQRIIDDISDTNGLGSHADFSFRFRVKLEDDLLGSVVFAEDSYNIVRWRDSIRTKVNQRLTQSKTIQSNIINDVILLLESGLDASAFTTAKELSDKAREVEYEEALLDQFPVGEKIKVNHNLYPCELDPTSGLCDCGHYLYLFKNVGTRTWPNVSLRSHYLQSDSLQVVQGQPHPRQSLQQKQKVLEVLSQLKVRHEIT